MPLDQTGSGSYVPSAGSLYLRKWQLSIGGSAGAETMVLSTETPPYDLRMVFHVMQTDGVNTPNTAVIRVYNLSNQRTSQIIKEFNTVQLQAGYVNGPYGLIFNGTIKQYKRGRESALDSYLDIFAAEGEIALNQATINLLNAARQNYTSVAHALIQQALQKDTTLTQGNITPCALPGGVLPREKVLYGMYADEVRDFTKSTGTSWTVQNGKIEIRSQGEANDDAVFELTSQTGMIEVPEATQDGIEVKSLLIPTIRVRSRVKIAEKDINQYFAPGGQPLSLAMQSNPAQFTFPGYSDLKYYATTANDGIYTVIVVERSGDTRGNDWYNLMTCLAWNPGAPACSATQGVAPLSPTATTGSTPSTSLP